LSNILSLNICWQLGNEQLLSVSQAFNTIAKQAMPFGNHLSLKKATAISVIFYRLIYAGDLVMNNRKCLRAFITIPKH
jgi:hypothetical protein